MVDRIKHSEENTNSETKNYDHTEEISNEIDTETRTEVTPKELESIEIEVGLEEITLDSEIIDTVATEQTNTEEDFATSDRKEDFELSSEYTPSYGTGLKGEPTDRAGRKIHDIHSPRFREGNSILTGGDLDANYEEADAVGDEAVGGTVATPDQDIVDNLGAAVGLEMRDRASLRTNLILEHRDEDRWETDPESSEDYEERQED